MSQYLRDADSPEVLIEIKKSIDNGNCIILIGSGLSTYACTMDGRYPPKRQELLKNIADWCLNESLIDEKLHKDICAAINSFHLEDAAKELKELLKDNYNLQRCIRDITLCSEAKISKIHCLLAKTPFRAYFTTNYDKFLETAYSRINERDLPRFYILYIKDILSYYQQNKPFIVKLNGDVDDPDSIFLAEQLKENNNDFSLENKDGLMWMISKSASLLFLGYNWDDPDVSYFLNSISKGSGQHYPHWIIAQKGHFPEFKAKRIFNDKGISIIQCEDNEAALVAFLEKLASIFPTRKGSIETRGDSIGSGSIRQSLVEAKKESSLFSDGIKVFCSYAHEDEEMRKELVKHLSSLKDEGLIKLWYDRKIIGGVNWETEIDSNLNDSQIILLLISSDFLNSHYCTGTELKKAREKCDLNEARVIPIILRDVDWRHYPFGKEKTGSETKNLGKLQAFPKDGLPVKKWDDGDTAFRDIADGIRRVIADLIARNR